MPLLVLIQTWFARYIIVRIIAYLALIGIGVTTFFGYIAIMDELQGYVVSRFAGLPSITLQYISLTGIPEAFGIILWALSVRALLDFAPKIGILRSAVPGA